LEKKKKGGIKELMGELETNKGNQPSCAPKEQEALNGDHNSSEKLRGHSSILHRKVYLKNPNRVKVEYSVLSIRGIRWQRRACRAKLKSFAGGIHQEKHRLRAKHRSREREGESERKVQHRGGPLSLSLPGGEGRHPAKSQITGEKRHPGRSQMVPARLKDRKKQRSGIFRVRK